MSIISKLTEKCNIKKALVALGALIIIIGTFLYLSKDSSKDNKALDEVISIDRNMSIDSVEDVEKVIAYWIDKNPEAIIASVTNMQKKAMQQQAKNAQKNISKKKSEIYSDSAPSYSPKGYDVTIVEFYDYNCGYCKQVNKSVEQLIKSDRKVRVIYRDFPILGKVSQELSEVSIAVHLTSPRKFRKFHSKLMSDRFSSKEAAIKAAGQVGINVAKLRTTLRNKKSKIQSILQENLALGSQVGITGTPAFVIGEELVPGALDVNSLKEKINAVR